MQGKTTRVGLYRCSACRQPFTVTVGTLYERSKGPLHTWLAVTFHINTPESFFSIVKRGITGPYHHVSEAHLHRYMLEFDYRYNTRGM
jgi:hypothetical protein